MGFENISSETLHLPKQHLCLSIQKTNNKIAQKQTAEKPILYNQLSSKS